MSVYHVYLLDELGKIVVRRDADAADDEAAIVAARQVLVGEPLCCGVELWEGERMVHQEMH